MSSFDRILLCYDATPEGQAALRCGATLAKQLRAETHLVAIFNCARWTRGFDVLSSVGFDIDEEARASRSSKRNRQTSGVGR